MSDRTLISLKAPALALALLALAGCAMNTTQPVRNDAPQVAAVPQGQVQSGQLPPIGQPGATPAPGLSGQPVLCGQPTLGGQPTAGTPVAVGGVSPTPVLTPGTGTQVAALPGTPPVAGVQPLSSGFTVVDLLGGWNIVSGPGQCRLNLTQTTKEGTGRYRASAPACTIGGVGNVASWQLVGTSVQLYDEGGAIVAALVLSGNRFIGTGSGGTALSMMR